MKVLVISNMGAKKSAPMLGLFVDKQVKYLQQKTANVSYFKLTFNGDGLFYRLFKYPLFFLQFIFTHVLSKQRFDIIHVHYYFPTIICAALYKIFRYSRVKILVTCHGGDIYCYNPPSWLYKKCSAIVAHWFFTSKKLAESFYRPVASYDVLCAGYDQTVFFCNQQQRLATNKTIDCLLVGNWDHNKGIDRLITLVKQMPKVKFAVIGAGVLADILKQCAERYDNLQILGSKKANELAQVLHNTKFLLSLSRNESFGLVICEAHACGTPCIVTETDGASEQLPHWEYRVAQKNISEQKVIEQLQLNIDNALNLTDSAYKLLQQQVIKDVQQYSLINVTSIITERYQQIYRKAQGGCVNVQ
jgi:L-malate glycosyltransferase